jgi:ABC-type phosphate transport system substrate-binding protein
MRAIHKIAVLSATVVAFGTIGTGTALADPPSGTVPALTSIVGVGSDTTTPLFSGSPTENSSGSLVTDYNATSPANDLWSWDAVNPSTGDTGDTIVTKGSSSTDTTCSITRPDGSSAGITELEDSPTDGGDPCVDFARSSRGPESTDPTTIAFVPFAGDAITYASPTSSSVTSPVPAGMTVADLADIYNCTWTNWDQVPGNSANDAPIVPVLPQSNSGTRSTFLLLLGGGTTALTPGSCVVNGTAADGDAIEENTGLSTGNEDQFGTTATSTTVDDVFPYSVGDYIAQGTASDGVGGHASSIWGQGDLSIYSMTDSSGDLQEPTTTNSSGQTVINQDLPMQRLLYNVVENGGTASDPAFPTTPSYEATALPAIFGASGWLCTNSTAQADITSYGFYSLGSECGELIDG